MTEAATFPLQVGSVLGRYELLLPIAKGGMAQVWAARLRGSRGFQKLVAIKTILPDVMDNTRMERMFMEEAQLAAQIHHPNVVQTLELGEHEGTLYLVMEWVDGEPLHRIMMKAGEQGGLPLPIAINLIGQACEGLQAAHDARDENGALLGVVHRDVSPQNLLVGFSGTAKLVDFGIAKVTAKSSGLTQAGEVKGKFAYMAPEQVRGQLIDARTDLFSLGILLYAITTGRHPFRGSHLSETLQNICSAIPAPPPSSFIPDYPSELEAVVLKSLAKAPEQRFASAPEMLAALHRALPGALAPGFDAQVAEFLKVMFGTQAAERRTAIRNAQHELDRARSETSASSVGTLRAISISNESGQFSVSPTPVPAPDAAEPMLTPPRRWRLVAGGVGASLLVLGTLVQLGRSPASSGSAAASSPVPRDVASFGASPVAAAPVAVSALPTSAPSTAPSAEAESDDEPRKSNRSRTAKGYRALPVASAAAATVAPVPPTPPASKPEPPPSTSTNAWDRGAFGGRH